MNSCYNDRGVTEIHATNWLPECTDSCRHYFGPRRIQREKGKKGGKNQGKGHNSAGRAKRRKKPVSGGVVYSASTEEPNTVRNGYIFPQIKVANTVKK